MTNLKIAYDPIYAHPLPEGHRFPMLKYELIPEDTDILITHGPPYGTMDVVRNFHTGKAENVGSTILAGTTNTLKSLKLHVFGHIHEGFGKSKDGKMVNASYVNEEYLPVNKPIRIEL